jgi:murein DD-endopeptidase MepM/ murein hydrolase activator NlpD
MRNDRFTLIIVPQGTAEMRQVRCSFRLLWSVLIVVLASLITIPAISWYLFDKYQTMQAHVRGLPRLNTETQAQHLLINRYEQDLQGIRQAVAQLERAQVKLLGLAGIESLSTSAQRYGLGGEAESAAAPLLSQGKQPESEAAILQRIAHLDQLKNDLLHQQQTIQRLEELLQDQQQMFATTPSIWPVPSSSELGSTFKVRTDPFTGKQTMHYGIDINAPKGVPIVASADGIVAFSGEQSSFGNVVVIDHGNGYTTFYGHCSKLETTVGEHVKRGDIIARVGSTGRSTGTHLHYEVRVDGEAKDPLPFILDR